MVRVPGIEAYEAVLRRLVSLLGFETASLFVVDAEDRSLREEASTAPGTIDASARGGVERIALSVGRRNLGLLLLAGRLNPLGAGESRVLRAFCDQLALVLERDRLLRVAAKAETYRGAEKLRRALLTAVSHDLRSPLSAIKASVTDLLEKDAPADAEYQRDVLDSVDKEVDRLNALIANLLDMSRIEAGMLRAHLQSVDVSEVLAQCVHDARRRWPGVRFEASVEPPAAVVRADPVFLDRVMTNLLDNAVRATEGSGAGLVEIQARRRDGRTEARVIDHGKGFPFSVRENLFHPFYELDERRSRLGRGLGLAICKGFLDSMGGEIWVEQTPGGGATLAFSLPVADGL